MVRIVRPGDDATDPRLVLRGASLRTTYRRVIVVQAALIAAWLAGVVAIRLGVVPWADGNSVAVYVPLVGGPLVALGVFVVMLRAGHSAAGEAALDERGATFTKDSSALRMRIEWGEVVGYRDGAVAFVKLVPTEGESAWSSYLGIPTPTEAERVAVLAFLDARGLKRLG